MRQLVQTHLQLEESLRELHLVWSKAKDVWTDDAQKDFEKKVWERFEISTVHTLESLNQLIEMVEQAEREMF